MLGTAAYLAQGTGGGLAALLPLVLMIGVFYFLLIRPQQKRARSQRQLIDSLEVDDEVVTIGGIRGTVRSVGDEDVMVEVAPGVEIELIKSAIARRIAPEEEQYGEDDLEGEEEEAGGQP